MMIQMATPISRSHSARPDTSPAPRRFRLQLGVLAHDLGPLASAGTGAADQELIVDLLAAALGGDRRATDQARQASVRPIAGANLGPREERRSRVLEIDYAIASGTCQTGKNEPRWGLFWWQIRSVHVRRSVRCASRGSKSQIPVRKKLVSPHPPRRPHTTAMRPSATGHWDITGQS
jgi:hypothetical protein